MKTLDQLGIKARATVEGFKAGDRGLINKLTAMGIVGGSEVEVVSRTPFGDPVCIRILKTVLSLRKSEASTIMVKLLGH